MPYLIDGHNLIPHLSGVDLKDPDDEMDLIERLVHFSRRERAKVEVYFDQAPPGQTRKQLFGFVAAFFVTRDRTADDAITHRLASLGKDARNWTVVSSDREVIRKASQHRARSLSAKDFADRMNSTRSHGKQVENGKWNPSPSEDEVDYWMKRFTDNSRE